MLFWWGMAALAAVLAAWFHWESGAAWRLKQLPDVTILMIDVGAAIFIALAVYMTAA